MTPHRARALVAIAAVGLLAACAPAPVETATPDPEPTVTVEPAPAPGSRPAPRTDATCGDFASDAAVDGPFGADLSLAEPERTEESIGLLSDVWAVRQAGGIACEWLSPDSIVSSEGRFGPSLRVTLLPANAALWGPYSAAVAGGGTEHLSCHDTGCRSDAYLASGWWLSVAGDWLPTGSAAEAEAALAPLLGAIRAVAEGLGAPASPWLAPAPEVVLPFACEGFVSGAEVAAAVGAAGGPAVAVESDAPGIWTAAFDANGGGECRWMASDEFTHLLELSWLPGGAWALAAANEAAEQLSGSAVPEVAIPGLATPGFVREHVDFVALGFDLGGNWVHLAASRGSFGGLAERDALVAVAARIVANLS